MNDKQKITTIYGSVAVLAVILISAFVWLGRQRDVKAADSEDQRVAISNKELAQKSLTKLDKQITEDLKGVNQNGEQVSLYQLKGKVVVFAQFYSRCNECLGHNKIIMQELHQELKDNPNVHFVTVTLDPEFDTAEKLKETAEIWQADSESWWMLNVPKEVLVPYCRKQLWYFDFKENEQKTSPADAIKHDMGIAVIDANTVLRAKANLFELLANEKVAEYKTRKAQLLAVIEKAEKETVKP